MNKADFLANIAQRLGRTAGAPQTPRQVVGVPEFWANRQLAEADCVDLFVERFSALGGEIETFGEEADLRKRLADILTELAPSHVGAWGTAAAWPLDVEDVLAKWPVQRWDEGMTPHRFRDVQVSVTGCAYAIADTGSIVMMSGPQQGRSVHVMPLVHIVVMKAAQVRLRLGEVLAEIHKAVEQKRSVTPSDLPASIHFVSGPSRSSDIENDQSIGVHGPARVMALLLR